MPYRALVVADDLTGAMDAGSEFAARGMETVVVLRGAATHGERDIERVERDVLVVDTDSRSAEPVAAARRVSETVETWSADVVYKKVDSTLRGNLVPEIDAAIDASSVDLALLAPAFPATGRTTIDGTHLVDGVPVAEALNEGECPETSFLPTLLSTSSYPVATCSLGQVERGPDAIRERLSEVERPAIVVCDASTEDHLDAIARTGASGGERVLYVGSAGLARHVRLPDGEPMVSEPTGDDRRDEGATDDEWTNDEWMDDESAGREPTSGAGTNRERIGARTVVGVAGSANPRTIEQVEALPTEQVIALDVEWAVRDPESVAAAASSRAIAVLEAGKNAVVTSVPDAGAIERARAAGTAARVDDVGGRIERALAAAVGRVHAERPFDGLFLTGGAVATTTLRELDASAIHLTGETVARGVPIGRIVDGRAAGARAITKAGGFGDERTIANCLARLEAEDE